MIAVRDNPVLSPLVAPHPGGIPRILLITWTPPGDRNVGEIILRDLCSFLPDDCLRVCEVSNFPETELGVPSIGLSAPNERSWRPLAGRAGGLVNHFRVRTTFKHSAHRLRPLIGRFAKAHQVDTIWVTLSSQTLIALAGKIADDLQVPMLSLVWDPPRFLAQHLGWDSASANWSQRNFDAAMKASKRAMVVSQAMVKQYERDYGLPCVIVRHALADDSVREALAEKDRQEVRIGFAGTLYDQTQLNCLVKALNALDWVIDCRPISLRMVGNFYRFTDLNGPANIELLGWRSTEETRRLLSECDFTYLPVPFAERFSEFARLAFPTKLSTFLAAGRPVLVHAPEFAAPVPFCRELGFGIACTSMEVTTLKDAIIELMTPESYEVFQDNVSRTCIEHFSRTVMRRQFAKFIGLDEALLND